MSLPSDDPPAALPAKPRLSAVERHIRQADRVVCIRLRLAIGRALEGCGITTPAAIGETLGMPASEAAKLLTRHQWREGDVGLLQIAAARLGIQMPGVSEGD